MEIKKELIKRDIAGDTVLVPVGKTVMENNGLFILNELGAFIWDMLQELGSEEEAVSAVVIGSVTVSDSDGETGDGGGTVSAVSFVSGGVFV